MKTKLFGFCLVGLIGMINGAYATGESTAATSQKYVDDALAGKQAILTAKTNDTIVTYPRTGGQAATVHEIKEEMGTSTSDTGIPTAGTLEGAIDEKISRVINLPNTNVMTYGGDGYMPASTPIYDSSVNAYNNALVRASTLNSAVATAARAKFTRVDENGDADANGALWQINTVAPTLTVRATLDATIGGTSYCYRGLNGTNNNDGQCSVTTKTAIGASGSKTGKWGTVFPYGEVVGRSVCSNVKPTNAYYGDGEYDYNWGYITSSAETTTLNGQFTAQSGTGTPVEGYKYCYCKMDSVDGTDVSAVSRWVFDGSHSSASGCAVGCANDCGLYVLLNSDFRSGVFGSVAP